ncbi:MAG: hypothetical protein ACRDHP_12145 [Ktedonobacterales bacterium]
MAKREKLLAKANQSQKGWTRDDVQRLYLAWGFQIHEGSNHTKYIHPKYPDLFNLVTRSSGIISPAYVTDAIWAIEELIEREKSHA